MSCRTTRYALRREIKNAKRTSAQQQSEPRNAGDKHSQGPYNGTAIKRRLLTLTAFPTLIHQCCRTRGHTIRRTKYATPALEKLSELSPISCSLIGFPSPSYLNSPYLASQLNREKIGHRDPRQTFQVTAHNTSRPMGYTSPVSQNPGDAKNRSH